MSRHIELVSLDAALADIDGKLRALAQSGLTPGEIVILREYWHHERAKVSKQIRLLQQESEIEELEVAYKFSQTPVAQAKYRRRINLIEVGRMTGQSRETHLPAPPHVSEKAALDRAKAERSVTQRELQELCNRDAEWDLLLPEKDAANQPDRQSRSGAQNRRRSALSPFDELAGRLMTEVRPRRSDKGRLPSDELAQVLMAIDKAGFKPLEHLGREWQKKLADHNQKASRRGDAIQSFSAASKTRFRRGVLKRLYEAEKKYRQAQCERRNEPAHFPQIPAQIQRAFQSRKALCASKYWLLR